MGALTLLFWLWRVQTRPIHLRLDISANITCLAVFDPDSIPSSYMIAYRTVLFVLKEMQMILDKYPENKSDYLLPIIRNKEVNEHCIYRNTGYNINHNLKSIAGMVGVNIPLTLYVARHSWASIAKAKGIPISVISEGMGHDSETTTQIYLASLEISVVDKANSLILKSLS